MKITLRYENCSPETCWHRHTFSIHPWQHCWLLCMYVRVFVHRFQRHPSKTRRLQCTPHTPSFCWFEWNRSYRSNKSNTTRTIINQIKTSNDSSLSPLVVVIAFVERYIARHWQVADEQQRRNALMTVDRRWAGAYFVISTLCAQLRYRFVAVDTLRQV